MTEQPGAALTGIAGFPNIARIASRGGRLATIVSAFAFAFSAVSFFETVLKQANLKVYVTDTLLYTRDPYGDYEVVALPITIANSGARDGAIVTLDLSVKNLGSGQTETFTSAFTADAQYFGGRDDVANRIKRPKLPFAPLSIAGRSAYVGTILFYSAERRGATDPKMLVTPGSKIDMRLHVHTPEPTSWLDRLFFAPPASISLTGTVGEFLPGALYVGDTVRVRLSNP
jgi:hypothetical protein